MLLIQLSLRGNTPNSTRVSYGEVGSELDAFPKSRASLPRKSVAHRGEEKS